MLSKTLERTLRTAFEFAALWRHEYATLEHLLVALADDAEAAAALRACGAEPQALRRDLARFVEEDLKGLIAKRPGEPKPTAGFGRVVQRAAIGVRSSGYPEVTGADVLLALFSEAESHAVYLLGLHGVTREAVAAAIGPRPPSTQAFVALIQGAEMELAWALGFEPGLRAAGLWVPAPREMDLGGGITGEILALLQPSRVLVADYTRPSDRVYFLAGVAVGLGIPVVSTCRADRLSALRRDACHPDPLAWRTPEELADMLAARVAQALGAGGAASEATGPAGSRDGAVDGLLLAPLTAALRELVLRGKERGYVTYEELEAAMPEDQASSEMVEDAMTILGDLGVRVLDRDDGGAGGSSPER